MTIRVLLPVFADWSDEYEWMCTKFLNKYLSEIEQQLSSTDDHAMSLLFTGFKVTLIHFIVVTHIKKSHY